jgi:hypothetical protein
MPLPGWLLFSVLAIVVVVVVGLEWRETGFWGGFRPPAMFVFYLVLAAIFYCYHTIQERRR